MILSAVPLARRNFLANRWRLIRSIAGIAFVSLLMNVELGVNDGFIGSNLMIIRILDGDMMLVSSTNYEFDRPAPFLRRLCYEARAVPGVASVRPFYVQKAIWKNPQTLRLSSVQVFAFDPDQPVLLAPEINAHLNELRQPDTVVFDSRARSEVGLATIGTETELSSRTIKVVGTFWLGPNFVSAGTVVMSDRNFFKLFGTGTFDNLPDMSVGVVKVLPGYQVSDVQTALRAAMPGYVVTLTKSELIDKEARYLSEVTAVGPIMTISILIGFAVGMLISYQILLSELSDQLSQYATLKAMGYQNAYLVKIVVQQAVFYALLGYVPAWLLCHLIFRIMGDLALLPMSMSLGITVITLALTVIMCVGSALIAVRRVIAADPAELFR